MIRYILSAISLFVQVVWEDTAQTPPQHVHRSDQRGTMGHQVHLITRPLKYNNAQQYRIASPSEHRMLIARRRASDRGAEMQ